MKPRNLATVSAVVMVGVVAFAGGMIFQEWLQSEVKPLTVAPAVENPDPLPYAFPLQYAKDLLWWSEKTRVPLSVLCRLLSTETSKSGHPTDASWDPEAISSAGAVGLSQLMPENTTDPLFVSFNDGFPIDPKDPQTGIKIAARYLAYLIRMKDGNLKLAVGAYNAGPYTKPSWWKPETVSYVKKILP